MLDSIIQGSNCENRDERTLVAIPLTLIQKSTVTRSTDYESDLWSWTRYRWLDGSFFPTNLLILIRRRTQDNSGTIERDEFLSLPQVSSNPLATRYFFSHTQSNPWFPNHLIQLTIFLSHSMIAIFDEDGGGDVDFQEFVSGLSAFSSKGNKEEKLRFAFKVYDIDRDGYISNGELFIVLKMMVGSNLKDQQLQQVCAFSLYS